MKKKHDIYDLFKMKLSQVQKDIIMDNSKFTLVTAGAGTGKSTTIINKIRYLIEIIGVKEKEIICISFTNESVNSLKNKLLSYYNYNIPCYTFHKLSLSIIKNDNYTVASPFLLDFIIDEYFENLIYFELDNIKRVLNYINIKYNDKNFLKKYNKINKNIFSKLKKDIKTFITLFKTYDRDYKDIFSYIKSSDNKNKDILIVICYIYLTYEEELLSNKMIDFDDMIKYALRHIIKSGFNRKIKYLIIDEFQDTSNIKFELIKAIQKSTYCNLFAVGDDFQSIYKFTGCDLNIFLNFNNYFKDCKSFKLEETYRNSNELVTAAGNFIMKNNKQIKKVLHSKKHINKPIVLIYYKNLVKSFINVINKIYEESKGTILVLGRNNSDINEIKDYKDFVKENNVIKYLPNKNIKIVYLTVHSAKGLEFDNVIILNLLDKKTGFPNKINNNSLLRYVQPKDDGFSLSEERRLFYVALTRTKNKCYLFTKRKEESLFIKELVKDSKKYIKKKG